MGKKVKGSTKQLPESPHASPVNNSMNSREGSAAASRADTSVIKAGYVITLKNCEEHRLDKLHVDFPRWSGVPLTPMLVERPNSDYSNMKFPIPWQTKMCGVRYYIGCGNSHRLCWEEISRQEEGGWYMVMESDVRIDFDNAQLVGDVNEFFNKHVPQDADIVALGNLVDLTVQNKWDLFKRSPLVWFTCEAFQDPILLPHSRVINDKVKIPFNFCGAHGYALTPLGARKLLDRLPDIRFHVDYEVSAAVARDPSIRLYSSRFNVFRQRATIQGKAESYPIFVNRLLDHTMCFDMSAAWNVTLPICYVFPVTITAWSIPLAATSIVAQVLGLLLIELSLYGACTAWLFNVILWCLLSFPVRGQWNQFFQQLYLTTVVPIIPILIVYCVVTYKFTEYARIFPPEKPSRETYFTPSRSHPEKDRKHKQA